MDSASMYVGEQFLGVKFVRGLPMSLGDYNKFKGWDIPDDEDPTTEGFLVTYPDGYQSWCPTKQFDDANRRCDALPFGHAIEAAKAGKKIARAGWNGKGIFVRIAWEVSENGGDRIENHLVIDTTGLDSNNPDAPRNIIPWLASQTDILADDWCVVINNPEEEPHH